MYENSSMTLSLQNLQVYFAMVFVRCPIDGARSSKTMDNISRIDLVFISVYCIFFNIKYFLEKREKLSYTPNIFSDEAHFWLNGYIKKKQSGKSSHKTSKSLHPQKVTAWGAMKDSERNLSPLIQL